MQHSAEVKFLKIGVGIAGLTMLCGMIVLGIGLWFSLFHNEPVAQKSTPCLEEDFILDLPSVSAIRHVIPYGSDHEVLMVLDRTVFVIDLCHNTVKKRFTLLQD